MGVTHYWERDIELPPDTFRMAVADCKKILCVLDIPLADAEGDDKPIFSDDEIIFNGMGGNGCEPFIFRRIQQPRKERNVVFSYCKTEHLPYDYAVKCCLIVLKYHFGREIKICSDDAEQGWEEAKNCVLKKSGYGISNLLSSSNKD